MQTKEAKQVKKHKKTIKSHAQAIGSNESNGKESENTEISDSKVQVLKEQKADQKMCESKEKVMQQKIDKMQIKIEKLMGLVTMLTKKLLTNEGEKSEIIREVNDMKEEEEMKNKLDVREVITNDKEELGKSNKKEVTKRKGCNEKTTPHHDMLNNEETKGMASYLNNWYADATDKLQRKRHKSNHE